MDAVKRTRGSARLPEGVTALARIGEDIERRWAARHYRRQELMTTDNDDNIREGGARIEELPAPDSKIVAEERERPIRAPQSDPEDPEDAQRDAPPPEDPEEE